MQMANLVMTVELITENQTFIGFRIIYDPC